MHSKLVLGLIGGIGSGKSFVAGEFARCGGRVVNGDALGHEGLRQVEIKENVVRRWGSGILKSDGEVDRRKVGAIVFANPNELRALEALLFPFIERRFREEVAWAEVDAGVAFVVLDAAVMLEAGWNDVCQRIVYIHSPRAQRLRRLSEQRGWSDKEVEAREKQQWSLTDKVSRADFAIDNAGSREQTARQVESLLSNLGIRWCQGSGSVASA